MIAFAWFRKQPRHLRTGLWGEKIAARHLRQKGYRIIARRVRFDRRTELDIVARKDTLLVFVEVKTRSDASFARPASAVNRDKRRHLSRAAARYLSRMNKPPEAFRFDIVEVIGRPEDRHPEVLHIPGAFQTEGPYHLQW